MGAAGDPEAGGDANGATKTTSPTGDEKEATAPAKKEGGEDKTAPPVKKEAGDDKAAPPAKKDVGEGTAATPAAKSADAPAAKPVPKKPEKPPAAWPYPAQHREATRTVDLDKVKERFGGAVLATGEMAAGKPVVYVDPASAWDVLRFAREELGFDHCSFVSACDYNKEGILEVHWQLYAYPRDVHVDATTGRDLVVKAHIPRDDARITSATGLWAGCDWHEREAWDLFGIHFEGHPDLRRIFMPEGWRGHPLRKDYDRSPQYIGMNEAGDDIVYDTPGPYRW